jgi:hypothetical protein
MKAMEQALAIDVHGAVPFIRPRIGHQCEIHHARAPNEDIDWPKLFGAGKPFTGTKIIWIPPNTDLPHASFRKHSLSFRPSCSVLTRLSSIMVENSRLLSDVLEGNGIFAQRPLREGFPLPAEVRDKASKSDDPAAMQLARPPPVVFLSLGLIVKYGSEVSVSEARCQILVRAILSPQVPVPEVYGWCTDGGQTFIYMELIEGITLEKRWDHLNDQERTSVCTELRHMVDSWRALTQQSLPPFIGLSQFFPDLSIKI